MEEGLIAAISFINEAALGFAGASVGWIGSQRTALKCKGRYLD